MRISILTARKGPVAALDAPRQQRDSPPRPRLRFAGRYSLAALLAGGLCHGQVFLAPKGEPAVYTAPHKPLTKLAEVKAAHASQKSWRHLVVDDERLRSEYIQAQPGYKTPRAFHPDTREWWVVWEGEVRFEIEATQPFVAKKGSMVQVPYQTLFTWEVVGDKPALLFDTNVAEARTIYEKKEGLPALGPKMTWVPATFPNREIAKWQHGNKAHTTFEEVAQGVDSGRLKGTQRIVEDDRGTANFIYGYNSKLPPLDEKNRGHYHPEGAEYWFIMKGQIRYPIEKVGVVIANEGDVVYVPKSTFHAPRWWGDGPSCRLAINGFPYIAHLFEPPKAK